MTFVTPASTKNKDKAVKWRKVGKELTSVRKYQIKFIIYPIIACERKVRAIHWEVWAEKKVIETKTGAICKLEQKKARTYIIQR